MQQLPLALILIKFPNNSKGSTVNMKSQGLVKHCLQVWPQDPRRHRRRTTPPRDGVGPGAEAADDREPGEGAQDGHPLGSHLRCRLHAAAHRAHCLSAG